MGKANTTKTTPDATVRDLAVVVAALVAGSSMNEPTTVAALERVNATSGKKIAADREERDDT